VRHYPPVDGELGKRAQVEAMFDSVAPRYDLLNRLLSLGVDRQWRKAAVNALRDLSPKHILDVATGTGDLALEVLRLKPERVIGVDLSKKMLALARTKAARKGVTDRVSFAREDAEALSFEDDAFDAALVGFGIRNFENPDRGLQELFRILRPGGRLVVLEFSQPQGRVFRWLYGFYGRCILPQVGRLLSRVRGPYTYLPDSIGAFSHGEAFLVRMRAVGFVNLGLRPMTFGVASLYVGQRPTAHDA